MARATVARSLSSGCARSGHFRFRLAQERRSQPPTSSDDCERSDTPCTHRQTVSDVLPILENVQASRTPKRHLLPVRWTSIIQPVAKIVRPKVRRKVARGPFVSWLARSAKRIERYGTESLENSGETVERRETREDACGVLTGIRWRV